jgi:uncharacterized membrane protein YhaH (DUF805 family)
MARRTSPVNRRSDCAANAAALSFPETEWGQRVGKIAAAVGRGFRSLFRFSGRDRPGQFWPYALFLIFLNFTVAFTLVVPMIFDTIARMQRFAAEHPELTTVESGPGHYSIQIEGHHPELMPDMGLIATGSAVLAAITTLLLAAAVTRRLHDRDRRGWWGLLPLPFLLYAMVLMPRLFASVQRAGPPPMPLFFSLFVNNALYLAALAALVILLVGAGTPGPNRFGEPQRP